MKQTSSISQTALSNAVSCFGVGLHGGARVRMTLKPAGAGAGIVFKRLDVPAKRALVPARYDAVSETRLGTTLKNRFGTEVATVEHLLAALWGAGVDNAVIELDGPEVPIMDGSAEPFLFLIECARVVSLPQPRAMLRVLKTVEVSEGESRARVEPNRDGEEGLVLGIEIDFDNKVVARQRSHYDFREVSFKQAVSRARTFGFEREVESLRQMGLARGGSLDNAIVVGEDRVLNEEGLRYRDEFVRHKALDCLGDLYLAGRRIDGYFTFLRPGHAINNKLLHALFADESAYEIVPAGQVAALLAVPARDLLPVYV